MISHFLDVFKTVHLGHWYFKADRPPSITFDWEIKNAFERNITVVQLETLGKKTHVKFSKRPQNHLISQSKVIKGGTGGEGGQFALCVKDPRIYPYDCQFSRWFQNCPDFSRWLPIFRMLSKLSGFFRMTANFLDDFKTVRIFTDDCQFSGWFQKSPVFSICRWSPFMPLILLGKHISV